MTNAYETAYVEEGVSAGNASEKVGTDVIKAVAQKYQSNNQIGKATIEIKGFGSISNVTKNAKVVVTTTDFKVIGTIYKSGGRLVWGEIQENNGEDLTEEVVANRINSAIGQVVNYSAGGLDSWRVFYADKDTQEMFIISTKTLDPVCLCYQVDNSYGQYYNKYTSSEDIFAAKNPSSSAYKYSNVTYGLTYNSRWAEALKGTGTTRALDATTGARMVASLCDTTNWESYISSTAPNGTYAVGAPTVELLASSWNAIGNTATWADSNVNSNGYVIYNLAQSGLNGLNTNIKEVEITETVNNTETTTKYGLYDNGSSYWLASPSSEGADRYNVCFVYDNGMGNGGVSLSGSSDAAFGIRPVVSIPFSGVELEEEGTGYTVTIK